MATSAKRRELSQVLPEDMLEIDFEGFNPSESDYHGIRILLNQLFLKAHIDLSELTDMIISQQHVGSVIKQAVDIDADESDDDDDDDDDDAINQVFGITTVINIISKQNVPCIQQFRNVLTQLADKHATDTANAMIKNVLRNDAAQLGLIINERFINIPAKISVPLIGNLISEIQRAKNKKMPFNFAYYLLICKLHKSKDEPEDKSVAKSKNENAEEESSMLWSNAEEEIFAEEAAASFEFCVEKEADYASVGKWSKTDSVMIPYRRVLLLEASKLQVAFNKIQNKFSH